MQSLYDQFFSYNQKLMEEIQTKEKENIEKAACLIADAVAESKNFFIHDRGHLIGGELLARAGGAAFVRRFDLIAPDVALLSDHTGSRKKSRDKLSGAAFSQRKQQFEMEYTDYTFDRNGLGEGDVLLLNSNSGFGFSAGAIAETAKKKGVKLIVISSRATAENITPEGGKKLSDYAEVFIDNHAPFGDAVFEVEGLDEKIWPASGMGTVYIAWPMVLRAVELLLEKGIRPTIYRSANIPGGIEQNREVVKRYAENGY